MKFTKFLKDLHTRKCALAVLVDPDKYNPLVIEYAARCRVNCFLVGGSSLVKKNISAVVRDIKKISKVPVILFPGDETQLTDKADGLLLLSLLSGRNPQYLIEKHIKAAPVIKRLKLNYLPTAYLLIDGGKTSTTQKVTGTTAIAASNTNEIIFTSMAGEQLGFKAIYLEAGSGAAKSLSAATLKRVKKQINIPVIVGGGINSSAKAKALIDAGANMLVVGNALEKDPELIFEIKKAFK